MRPKCFFFLLWSYFACTTFKSLLHALKEPVCLCMHICVRGNYKLFNLIKVSVFKPFTMASNVFKIETIKKRNGMKRVWKTFALFLSVSPFGLTLLDTSWKSNVNRCNIGQCLYWQMSRFCLLFWLEHFLR